ncbi:MAG: hypothetical protein AAF236_14475 [Verrucomicrobiota bacterium]
MKFRRLPVLQAFACGFLSLGTLSAAGSPKSGRAFADDFTVHSIGRWGVLESRTIILEPLANRVLMQPDYEAAMLGTVWHFEADSVGAVADQLRDLGLRPEILAGLLNDSATEVDPEQNRVTLQPDTALVAALSPMQRSRLYSKILFQDPVNSFYAKPFIHPREGISGLMLRRSGLSRAQLSKIEAFTYRVDQQNYFSDLPLLFESARDDRERFQLIRFLSREKSYAFRLSVSNPSDWERLEDYWAAGGLNPDPLPLLKAATQSPQIAFIDGLHLLPPLPRKLLHTYPSIYGNGVGASMPDCYWTAFNFFDVNPSDRIFDRVDIYLESRYETIAEPDEFGDLMLISDPETGKPVHACNYIAGDLFFTKNGLSMARPWVVERRDEILSMYAKSADCVQYFRLRGGT